MKKLILFLMFTLAVQIGYKISPVLAQEDKYAAEIQKTIEKFFKACAYLDIDSAMQLISVNYSEIVDNNIVDYAKYKSRLENSLNIIDKKYVNYSFYDLEIVKLNMQDDKATVETRFNFRGFNLDDLREDEVKRGGIVTLAKENGTWKITQSKILREYQ